MNYSCHLKNDLFYLFSFCYYYWPVKLEFFARPICERNLCYRDACGKLALCRRVFLPLKHFWWWRVDGDESRIIHRARRIRHVTPFSDGRRSARRPSLQVTWLCVNRESKWPVKVKVKQKERRKKMMPGPPATFLIGLSLFSLVFAWLLCLVVFSKPPIGNR